MSRSNVAEFGALREKPNVRCLIGPEWRDSAERLDVVDPYSGEVVAHAPCASDADVRDAITAAVSAKAEAAAPGYQRADLLRRAQALVRERAEDIAHAITLETGKALKDSRIEIRRSADTIGLCAEEAIRIEGKQVPLDGSELGAGKIAMMLRFPAGVVGAIVPFNAPFNMACHKVGPALAAGNAVVFKAPPEAPTCIQLLAQIFLDAGLSPGILNVVHGGASVGAAVVRDPRVDVISFTGSVRAGLAVKTAAGIRRTILELGGLGPNIVHKDAAVAEVAPLCALHGMRLAGQSCISVQNLFVHRDVLADFLPALIDAVRALKLGNPMDPATDVGPMINRSAAERVEAWVEEARAAGARALCGARRRNAFYEPTVLIDVTPQMKVVCEEVFGPVIVVRPYADLDDAITWINATGLGLHCGVFTESMAAVMHAVRTIRCGGIIVNGTSSFRPDQTPYGGVGLSGNSREGPARAVLDMTDERLVVFNY